MEEPQDSKHEPENIQLPTHCTKVKGTNLGNFCIHVMKLVLPASVPGYTTQLKSMHGTNQKRPT